MVAVVTGAAGFLGAHAAIELERRGTEVVRAGRPAFEIPSPEFDRLLASARPSLVVHCAGPASVPASVSEPETDRRGSVDVTRALVRRLERLPGPPRMVLLSSAGVYGQPPWLPIDESVPPAPISPYGRHRLEAEQVALSSAVPTTVLRVFSAYGCGLRRQVLWDVAVKARASAVVDLWGTGDETRDFVHATDVARAIARVGLGDAEPTILNVGSGEETTIRSAATLLLHALGAGDVVLRFNGLEREGDPRRWCADVRRLRELGWAPRVALEDGIARYAKWLQSEGQ